MTRPRIAVVAPTLAVMERFEKSIAAHASMTAVCLEELETEDCVVERIDDLLQDYAVDVVVIAPACNNLSSLIQLPPSWKNIPKEKVVLQAKPVTALSIVWMSSWMANKYTLDGAAL